MHKKDIRTGEKSLAEADKALILLHGRGAPAEDILGLARALQTDGFAVLAPQATNYTWYPQSFLAPRAQNEPWLSSALALLETVVEDITRSGIPSERIYLAGFSQGACLALEFATRQARRWGGVAAFTGGLIGETIDTALYTGHFEGTRVFIGSSDPDSHVPVGRVRETSQLLEQMGAAVRLRIYPEMGHTITQPEIDEANAWVFRRESES